MSENLPYVLLIGGANIDFTGIPNNPLILHDSNIGVVKTSLGGVARNIAENLARLGVKTKLLSLVGSDAQGTQLIQQTANVGVDMSAVEVLEGHRTSTYFSVMDVDDMAVAIADMAIIDLLTPKRIKPHKQLIEKAELVILDTNLSQDTLEFLLTQFPQTQFLVDAVSVNKVRKICDLLPYIDTLKPNRLEAEFLTGINIKSIDDGHRAIDSLIEKGVKHIFMSLGQDGLLYGNSEQHHHCPARATKVVNATGAGDSMMAAITYGRLMKLPIDELLAFANATASLTLMAETTISPDLSVEAIKKLLNQQ